MRPKKKRTKPRSILWALGTINGALNALSEEDRGRMERAMAIIWGTRPKDAL